MTPTERQMLENLFERIRRNRDAPRDPEAEEFIEQEVRREPGGAYALAQAALIQELGSQRAEARIADLTRQLEAAKTSQPSRSSFLGDAAEGGPWGPRPGSSGAPMTRPPSGAAAYAQPYAQPPTQPYTQAPGAAAPAAGSFLRGAAQMAAGVAGGVLAAEALTSLLHGGFGAANAAGLGGNFLPPETVVNETVINEYGGAGSPGPLPEHDPGTQAADYPDTGASPDPGLEQAYDPEPDPSDYADDSSDWGDDQSV